MINIALPKGRLGEKAYNMLKISGYECPEIENPGRKLIFENPEKGVRYFWVKPSDVAIYVERGAADLGIVRLHEGAPAAADGIFIVRSLQGGVADDRGFPHAGIRDTRHGPSVGPRTKSPITRTSSAFGAQTRNVY